MLTILRTRTSGGFMLDSIDGARLSYGSGANADSTLDGDALTIGPNDTALCRRLVLAGGGEDKFLRTMPVSVFIQAPLRWWFDADAYKVGTVKQSSSLMHFMVRHGEFKPAHFTATTDSRLIAIANEKFAAWVAAGGRRNFKSVEWEELQDSIGRGYLYTAQWYASYAAVRNAFRQRRHHRQAEWRTFCAWATTLPYADLLITLERDK